MTLLLVLRPQPGADATAARAAALGHEAVVAPLFDMRPLPWTPPDGPFDALMLTSANAVRHAGPALDRYRHLPVHAVGAATAAAARAAGLAVAGTGDADAAALVAGLGGMRVLHLAGRDHRAPLPPGGVRRIVYAADPAAALPAPAIGALARGAIVLLHSPRAAVLFARLSDDAGLARGTIGLAALSPAVTAAAGAGWRAVRTAAAPTDAALLAAMHGAAEPCPLHSARGD